MNLPVDGSDQVVLVGQLQRVDDTDEFGGETTGAGRVIDDGADDLLGINEEDGADGQGHALGVDIGGVLVVDHVVQVGDFAGLVGNNGVFDGAARDFVDILNPFLMGLEGVGAQADELDIAFVKFRLEFGNSAELEAISIRVANSEDGIGGGRTSVVQTGVKSSGWENKMAYELPMYSWNLMGPFVVSASKSGATLPNLNFFCSMPSTALPIFSFFAGGDETEILAAAWSLFIYGSN